MKKILLTFILSLSLLFGILPISVFATFSDVQSSDWFSSAVKFVSEKGLMKGMDETTFGPNQITTRGMFLTILYRLEGSPKVNGAISFSDVSADQYYAEAAEWGLDHGIVNGYENGTFCPNAPITREQLTAMLFRYADGKGTASDLRSNFRSFEDADKISDYAVEPMAWAVAEEFINGVTEKTLEPQGLATRAQMAEILMRFCHYEVEGPSSNSDLDVVERLKNDSCYNASKAKKAALVAVAQALYEEEFEPAFIAGVLGNVLYEGTMGQFESSSYVKNPENEPDYLVYMDEIYHYRENYSGKNITQVDLREVKKMVDELDAIQYKTEEDGRAGFGLGCVQWTFERTKTLVDLYIEIGGNTKSIAEEDVERAEALMIVRELQGSYYNKTVYQRWKTANSDPDTEEAAVSAGKIVCVYYEGAGKSEERQMLRGEAAAYFYRVMTEE